MSTIMTNKELADLLKISVHTIRKWRKKGMPYYPLTKTTIRFDKEEVEKWLTSLFNQETEEKKEEQNA